MSELDQQQAEDIAAKLHRVGYGMLPVAGQDPVLVTFTDAEIEVMAEMEHARWMAERHLAGWVYDPVPDNEDKRSPYLLPYAELSEDVKERDREAVRAIPRVLALAGFEVRRL